MSTLPNYSEAPRDIKLQFDVAALHRSLVANGCASADSSVVAVTPFSRGQSNPTFLVRVRDGASERKLVLRKKPHGQLLASAHQVDREFRVMRALAQVAFPVPRMHYLCTDRSVLGTEFYIMDFVDGRIFSNAALLADLSPAEREAATREAARVLAQLHDVDVRAVGLADLGRHDGYYARSVARWADQYSKARTDDLPAMDALLLALPRRVPAESANDVSIVHGDFKFDNIVFHPTEMRIVAVLDWELSTLGHWTADLAYFCMTNYHLLASSLALDVAGVRELGLLSEREFVDLYMQSAKRAAERVLPDATWRFCVAFSLFKLAGIMQGVYRRYLNGNSADPAAVQFCNPQVVARIAEQACRLIDVKPVSAAKL
jgi:aminoglycoside phosphotransferase (APT) family kinase protein